MKIIKSAHNYYAAYTTIKQNLLYSNASRPDLKFAPHVTKILRAYNRNAVRLLNQKRYGAYGATDKGFAWYYRVPLGIGMLKADEAIKAIEAQIQKRQLTMLCEQKEIRENRMECQAYEKPHLVQRCNNMERQLENQYIEDILKLNEARLKVVNRQIQSITEAENSLTVSLEACMDQIQEFYAMLSQMITDEWLQVPNMGELETIVPLQKFPDEYITYREQLMKLRDVHQNTINDLKAQLGV